VSATVATSERGMRWSELRACSSTPRTSSTVRNFPCVLP
jgi:hypothetical protein